VQTLPVPTAAGGLPLVIGYSLEDAVVTKFISASQTTTATHVKLDLQVGSSRLLPLFYIAIIECKVHGKAMKETCQLTSTD
jgi:hypothetical protein